MPGRSETLRYWSEVDIAYVERNYWHLDTAVIAKHLGRTVSSIRKLAHKRGVTKRYAKGGDPTNRAYLAGRIGVANRKDIAERAAGFIMSKPSPRCVCIDPNGRVTVTPDSEVQHPDAIGVYSARDGLKALYDSIYEDLPE